MLADISLDGSETSSRRNIKPFLSNNPTAKILVLVDTHCLEETGAFVWKGTDEPTYEACYLQEVMSDVLVLSMTASQLCSSSKHFQRRSSPTCRAPRVPPSTPTRAWC